MKAESEPSHPAHGPSGSLPTVGDRLPPGPKQIALLIVGLILAALAFGPLVTYDPEPTIAQELEGVFFTPADTSPGLVLVMAGWLLFRRWHRVEQLPLAGGSGWLAAFLLGASVALVGWSAYVGASDLRTVSLMLSIQGLACLFGGFPAMRVLAVPTAFLLFAIPLPAPLSNFWLERMQLWTAQFSGWILSAVGQTVLVTGDQILRGGQRFAIIETCSGVRITETLSMLAILMLNLFRRTPLHAAVVLAVTPPVAFLCNSLRAVTLILNPYADIGEIHTAQGIGMMLGGLLVLYAIDGLVGRLIPPGRPAPAPAAPATAAPVSVLRMGIGMAVLAVAALLSRTVTPWEPWNLILSGPHLETLSDVPGWTSKPLEVDYRFLGRLGIQDDLYRRYYRGGETVELYIGVGASQVRPRSPLFGKADLPGSGWHIEERSVSDQIPEGGGGAVLLGSTLTRRFVVVSWHENAQGLVSEALRSFFATDRNRWRRRGQGLVVRLGTPVAGLGAPAREAAAARLLRFYGDLRPRLATLNRALEVPE